MSMRPNQAKAVAAAQQIMKDFDLGDLNYVITEYMDHEKLFKGVDPDYSRIEKKSGELYERLEKMLETTGQGKQALVAYSDNRTESASIREIGFFYLGYAAAQRLGASPSPRRRSK
jgi:hypothetical protein